MIAQLRRRVHHAPRVARRADTRAHVGEGHKVVLFAVTTADARKAVGEDAIFEVLAKRLTNISTRLVVGALAVELTCAGEF